MIKNTERIILKENKEKQNTLNDSFSSNNSFITNLIMIQKKIFFS